MEHPQKKKTCFSDTAVVIIIKSGKGCSVGSFSTMLLWHCVYQIKMTCLWTLFWTHLHGKQVYECNEQLLAPLQLLMQAKNHPSFASQKHLQKQARVNPSAHNPSLSSVVIRTFHIQQIWHLVFCTSYYLQPQGMCLYLVECKCKNVCFSFEWIQLLGVRRVIVHNLFPKTVTFV